MSRERGWPTRRSRRAPSNERGSASLELVAAIPLLAALAVVSWYLAAGLVAAIDANERLVRAGLDARSTPERPGLVALDATGAVPALAGLPALELTATASVLGR